MSFWVHFKGCLLESLQGSSDFTSCEGSENIFWTRWGEILLPAFIASRTLSESVHNLKPHQRLDWHIVSMKLLHNYTEEEKGVELVAVFFMDMSLLTSCFCGVGGLHCWQHKGRWPLCVLPLRWYNPPHCFCSSKVKTTMRKDWKFLTFLRESWKNNLPAGELTLDSTDFPGFSDLL